MHGMYTMMCVCLRGKGDEGGGQVSIGSERHLEVLLILHSVWCVCGFISYIVPVLCIYCIYTH